MGHAVDIAGKSDKQAEFGNVLDLANDFRADLVVFGESLPRIGEALLQAKADAALLGIGVEHQDFDLLARRDDLSGMDVLFRPTHLGNVNQAFDSRFQFDKSAIIGDVGDPAGKLGADRELGADPLPRVLLELLHAQRDALGFAVEADNLHLDGLADLQGIRRMVDAPPSDVGDVEEAVDAAEVDESAVNGDVFDHAFQNLALLEVGDEFGTFLGAGFL